ncbi:uncharacterized protein DS421_2g41680 [Arachis hypogaea]|nr:uncharacterized protein DS421_2g41680 [Arachis hypogaea]
MQSRLRKIPNLWYFLAEIEELEQKSGSETEKALQMLSGSDLLTLGRAFLELQKSEWSILNNYEKLTFRAFQQHIIVHTLLQIRRPKTGVQRQFVSEFDFKEKFHCCFCSVVHLSSDLISRYFIRIFGVIFR